MINEKKNFQPRPKYTLSRENIIPVTKLPDHLSQSKKSLGWPKELSGTGRVIEGTNKFEVSYPDGDVFLSFGVTVHGLGHLRQEEFSEGLSDRAKKENWDTYVETKETDAHQRGLERLKKYYPERFKEMETKFQSFKKQGKLKDYANFEELYWEIFGMFNINRALSKLPEEKNEEKRDQLEYQALKDAGIDKYFKKLKESRVGEKIDKEWIEDFIMKMAEKISNE